ncbi:deoxyguanosinetriphosphate triphosphohydrolase [Anaeromicrobium sediminis]|uniref:Deoxyguanosinetriphosphate triphosphohydrolase-like protein n=1 Tax=Anaeromicrobium sediminis TaxID=1478221 RepID=A0A267MI25_9FIRM|nr:deoxyguanosinetriphosphate triphosphohydrolase [Anaeromicrobium sediminis]PAB59062.1 deoxyguanosinetriphosphate triphosphohydrolase [Anaeromicrobium sediminis]
MNGRVLTEEREEKLSKYAAKSYLSKGRRKLEERCDIRTVYQRDRDRIIHSKSFRRLKDKTQVFIAPEKAHYRTRLTHTLEVAQISRTIARALNLNEDLTEAIALGHDLGHTPFGHCGEEILNEIHENGFKHNEQSLRIVDFLEKKDAFGLNLTYEVRDGILNHTGNKEPFTLEGQIVKISDRIAYINHDIDDAIRGSILKESQLPKDCLEKIGNTHSLRINNMILDIINNSDNKDRIQISKEMKIYMDKLREFMFKEVYLNPKAKKEEKKAQNIIKELYYYFLEKPEKLPIEIVEKVQENRLVEAVKDYVAGMTDKYALKKYMDIFVPKVWRE